MSLRPITFSFVLFGFYWGGWAVAAADVERSLSLSHAGFGLLLSAGLAGAAIANALGGALAERRGTASVLTVAWGTWGGLLLLGSLGSRVVLFAVLPLIIATGGFVDVAMNVAATAGLAGEPGRLVRFHARFNLGAAGGAMLTGAILTAGFSWQVGWALIGAGAVAIALWTRRAAIPASGSGEAVALGGAFALLRREHLLFVAAAFGLGAMVEGGVDLWGVLYLRTALNSGVRLGAASAVAGYLVAAAARIVFGPAAGRKGATRGILYGASAACIGILVLATAPTAWLSGLGLVVAAGGISMCWPLMLALASAGRERPGAVIGAVSSMGYLGLVVGPSVVGGLAGAFGLRASLLILALAAAFVAAAPRRTATPLPP